MTTALDRAFDPQPSGILAVLAAADTAHRTLTSAQWVASFAPPITGSGRCVCGSTYEKRGSDQITVTADEEASAVEAVAEMMGRAPDTFVRRVVIRVIEKVNHERAVAEGDADRNWYEDHAYCRDDLDPD